MSLTMNSIKSLLLESNSETYLVPAIRFISLVRPKEVSAKGESLTALFQGETVLLKHTLAQSIYCAVLYHTEDKKLVVPLSKVPKPINITKQNLSWHAQERGFVVVVHPDYPDTIAKIL